jgi:hypothetical protein
VRVVKIEEYYLKEHPLPFKIDGIMFSFPWPSQYYPMDSTGSYSEYSDNKPPMAADGVLFWGVGSSIIWLEQNKFGGSNSLDAIKTYSSLEYAILDYQTGLPYVSPFSMPPIMGDEKG